MKRDEEKTRKEETERNRDKEKASRGGEEHLLLHALQILGAEPAHLLLRQAEDLRVEHGDGKLEEAREAEGRRKIERPGEGEKQRQRKRAMKRGVMARKLKGKEAPWAWSQGDTDRQTLTRPLTHTHEGDDDNKEQCCRGDISQAPELLSGTE